ncbi:MAG: hypothetical protein GQ558_06100, partial [Thermoplasmata archaeon]|nr:hypothetical protein [Thermoplasmata archaeon]
MKRLMAILILTMFLLSSFSLLAPVAAEDRNPEPNSTTTRVVLAELFTGAGCGPCINVDYGLDDFMDSHTRTEAVALVYHRSIPSADKLETSETISRQGFYVPSGVGHSTPNQWVDGGNVMVGGFSTRQQGEDWFEGKYTTERQDASQLSMDVSGIISPSLIGTIWVNVTALEDPDETNLFLHTVIVRKAYGPYNGGNGVLMHHFVVRKMLPTHNGDAFIISSGQTVSKEYQFDLSNDRSGTDYFTKKDDMAIVAFVQSHTKTKVTSEGAPRERYIAPVLQATHGDFFVIPNKAPSITQGQLVSPLNPREDDDVTFKVFYQDVDDLADFGPAEAKVYFKNETSSVMEHGLSEIPTVDPWRVGKWVSWTTKLDPGTYTYRFSANDGEADALGDVGWNATEVLIKSRNKLPDLMASSYIPLHDDTTTEFRFDVMYRDFEGEEPTSAKIHLNGMGYDMTTDSSGPFNDWVTYYYDTTLPVGTNHKFYFIFSDGTDERRFPPVSDSPNWIMGPEVEPPNNEPTLTTALFSPNGGTRMDEFTFAIIYTDGEGDHPVLSYIYIDDVAYIMSADGEDYLHGQTFRFTTGLGLGEHWIRYQFSDGKHEARFPAAGAIEGPLVTNLAPLAVIDRPSNDQRFTPDDYVPFSAVGSEDPEDDDLTFLWVSDIDGQLSSAQAFDKPLSEGVHVITLTVTDEYGGEHTTSISVLIKPREPAPFIEGYVTNNGQAVEKDMVKYTVTLNNNGEANAVGVEVRFIVDGVTHSTETIGINVGVPKSIVFTWEAMPGEHEIVFEIVGDTLTITEYVDANALPVISPAPREKVDGSKYKVGEQIYFDPFATDGNEDPIEYLWTFGDGTTSTSKI